jgi:hypothetical protein
MTISLTDVPVRKSIVVDVPVDDAFEVFTHETDTWWPRTHHIGTAPMRRVVVEEFAGGRCYTEQEDGSECDWGQVLEWGPPTHLVLAWQITHQWGYEPDVAKASVVEVNFHAIEPESTRVELEHRHFDRQGAAGEIMRKAVEAPNGWTGILSLYAARIQTRTQQRTTGMRDL